MRLNTNKFIKYQALLTNNQTLKPFKTQVIIILHIIGKACIDYGLQKLKVFIYGFVRRGRFITIVIKWTTTSCDLFLNDDIEVVITNLSTLRQFSQELLTKSILTLRLLIRNIRMNYRHRFDAITFW